MIHQKMNRKWKIASLDNFYGKMWIGFCLNTGKRLFVEVSFSGHQKDYRFLWKIVPGIFKISFCLRDQHVFTWQSLKILNVFITLTLKQVLWKTKHFFRKLESRFLLAIFLYKTSLLKTKSGVRNWRSTKNRIFPLTPLFFWKFNFSVRTP